jgi:TonB-dependent receptor
VAATAVAAGSAVEEQKRSYRLPHGEAVTILAQFATESGRPILFMMDAVRGEQTNALTGSYTPREALDRLLAGTALVAVHDPKSGGFIVNRRPVPSKPPQAEATKTRGPPEGNAAPPSEKPQTAQPSHNESPPVKKLTFFALLAGWLTAAPADNAQNTGAIEGRVFNAATGVALVNARVTLDGTPREAITDVTGSFRLSAVPAGEARLMVAYIGMERETATITVSAGSIVQREFELRLVASERPGDLVRLKSFTVVADREMSAQALAMNEQRVSPNLKQVVAIDEFGDRGNENIGDFLVLLPGVSVINSGLEPFEVSVRGIPSNASGLTIDGGEVASTRNERTPNLRTVPMSNISRVEVTKVPTPDVSANGLGGTINLVSRSGLETTKPVFYYKVYSLFHDSTGLSLKAGPRNHLPQNTFEWKQPSYDFTYSLPVTPRLSLTAGFSRTWRMVPRTSGNDEIATWNLVSNFQTVSQWTTLVQLNKTLSGQLGADLRVGSHGTLSVSYHKRHYELPITRSTAIFTYGAGATGDRSFSQGAASGVGNVLQSQNWRVEGYYTDQLAVRYQHRGPRWHLDASMSGSYSKDYSNDLAAGTFRTVTTRADQLVIRGEGLDPSLGTIHRKYAATTRTGQPFNIYDGRQYTLSAAGAGESLFKTEVLTARINATRDLSLKVPVKVKIGTLRDQKSSNNRSFPQTFDFLPNGASTAEARRAGLFDVFDEQFLAQGPSIFGVPYREVSNRKVYDLYRQHPDWFVLNAPLAHQNRVLNSREYTETVTAGYVRTDWRLLSSKLWLVAGVRYELTENEGRGPQDDINAIYQRDATGRFLVDAAGRRVLITANPLAQAQLRYRERAARAERSYDDFFPSLNASYELGEKLLLRAAYARTIGRPALNFIIPGITVTSPDVANPTITVSNVGLKPWIAHNYDLTLESYSFKGAVGSVGVFRKEIANFFGSRRYPATPGNLAIFGVPDDGGFDSYEIATRENVGDAVMSGFELSYRQSLDLLGSWAKGLQVFANYTKLKVAGSSTAEFTGFNPETASAGINYVRGRFLVKTTYSFQAEARRNLS